MPGGGVGISAAYGALKTDKETGRMQVGALIGNLDPNTFSDNIIAIKMRKTEAYEDKITINVDKKIPAVEDLRTKVEALGNNLKKLTNDLRSNVAFYDSSIPNALNTKISRSKESDGAIVLSIDSIAKASITDYDINVTQKATADRVTCGINFKSLEETVGFSGNLVVNNQIIPITQNVSTLSRIINDINSTTEFSNVKASSLHISNTKGYVLILESTKLAEPINFLGNAGTDALILGVGGLNITPTDPSALDETATDQITTAYTNASKTAAVGFSGNLVINGQAIPITGTDLIDATNPEELKKASTLNTIMDSINYISDKTNVTASISNGPNFALVLTSTETGVPIKFDALTTDASLKGGSDALVPLANTDPNDLIGEDQIAIKDKITSTYTTTDPAAAANFSGNLLINNQLIKVTASSSLNTIIKSINALSKEAKVIAKLSDPDESGNIQLVIEGTQAGIPIDFDGKKTDDSLRGAGKLILSTINKDSNLLIAKLSINGSNIERLDNIISDAIAGVRITIDKVSTKNTVFAIDYDKQQAFSAINEFITNYNLVVDGVNEHKKMNADGKTPDEKAILYGEDILNSIDNLLRYATNFTVAGSDSSLAGSEEAANESKIKNYKGLGDIGIMIDSKTGKLNVNTQTLQEKILNSDFEKIVRLFGNFAQSTNSQFYASSMPEKLTTEMAGKPINLTYSYNGATSTDETFAENFTVPEPTKKLSYSVSGQTVSLTYALNDDGTTYSATITGNQLKDEKGQLISGDKCTSTAVLSNSNKTFTFPDDSIYAGLIINFKDDASALIIGSSITTTLTLPQFTATLSMDGKEDVLISNVRDDFIKAPKGSIYEGLKLGYDVTGNYLRLGFNKTNTTILTLTEGISVGFDKAVSAATTRYNPSNKEVPTSAFDVAVQILLEENKGNENRIKDIVEDAENIRKQSNHGQQKLYAQAHRTEAISQMLAAELASHYG